MIRAAILSLLLAAAPSSAAGPFDGAGSIEIPKPDMEALQEAAAEGRQSGADL